MKIAAFAMANAGRFGAAQKLVRIGQPFANMMMPAWTENRDLPVAPAETFREWWAKRR